MTFPAYPEYKDSGVEWLGKVPEHWSVFSLKHVVSMRSGEQITSEDIKAEGEYPVFGGNGLRGYFDRYTHEGNYCLIGRQGALCGNINFANGKFWASEHAVVVTPKTEVDVYWIGMLLQSMNLGQYSTSAAQPGLSVEALGNLKIPFVSFDEQKIIGNFLDYETSKIDALIQEQKQLIELLNEKRQSIISNAVCRGLDPNVSMKDSGFEGIGMIPLDWSIVRFSRIINKIKDGTHGTFIRVADGFPLLSAKNVNNNRLEIDDVESMICKEDHEEITSNGFPQKGDLLLTIVGTIGRSCVYNLDYPVSFQRSVCFIRLEMKNNANFFNYLFQSDFFQTQLTLKSKSSAQAGVYMGDVASLSVIFPPNFEKQKLISKFLDEKTSELNSLIGEAKTAVALLQERRSALITAAVCGQIDVRGFE